MLHRAPETPGGPRPLKDDLISVLFLILVSGYENMNVPLMHCLPFYVTSKPVKSCNVTVIYSLLPFFLDTKKCVQSTELRFLKRFP